MPFSVLQADGDATDIFARFIIIVETKTLPRKATGSLLFLY
jgi:hypothetical protein